MLQAVGSSSRLTLTPCREEGEDRDESQFLINLLASGSRTTTPQRRSPVVLALSQALARASPVPPALPPRLENEAHASPRESVLPRLARPISLSSKRRCFLEARKSQGAATSPGGRGGAHSLARSGGHRCGAGPPRPPPRGCPECVGARVRLGTPDTFGGYQGIQVMPKEFAQVLSPSPLLSKGTDSTNPLGEKLGDGGRGGL